MTAWIHRSVFVALAFWMPVCGAGSAEPSAVVDAFHEALAEGNDAAALALLAEDVRVYESGGEETSRREYRESHLGADMEFSKSTTRHIRDRTSLVQDGISWVLTTSEIRGEFRGRDVAVVSTETMILERIGGEWQIAHIHWSSHGLDRP